MMTMGKSLKKQEKNTKKNTGANNGSNEMPCPDLKSSNKRLLI